MTKRNEFGIKFFSKHGEIIIKDETTLIIILHKNTNESFIKHFTEFYFSNYVFIKKYKQTKTENIIWEFKLKEKIKTNKNIR